MGFRGASFAPPHKQAVVPLLDALSDAARDCGAVNCMRREGDQLIGENTEGVAFRRALGDRFDPAGKSIVLLGAGATANAIAFELGRAGAAHLEVVNRSRERGEDLVARLNARFSPPPPETSAAAEPPAASAAVESPDDPGQPETAAATESQESATAAEAETAAESAADEGHSSPAVAVPFADFLEWTDDYDVPTGTHWLINATTLGMLRSTARLPLAEDTLEGLELVADLAITPTPSGLLNAARQHRAAVLDGMTVMVLQTALAITLWTDLEPDADVLRDAIEEYFGV